VRIFTRLFSALPILVLLAGVALAQPALAAGTNHSLGAQVSKCQFIPGYNHPPSPPRLYFGTVVRDTADEDGVAPGPGEMPAMLQQQVPQDMPLWNSFFAWSWFSSLLALR
jgi:hypothetical protein